MTLYHTTYIRVLHTETLSLCITQCVCVSMTCHHSNIYFKLYTVNSELSGVKEHDLHVTEQSRIAEDSVRNQMFH